MKTIELPIVLPSSSSVDALHVMINARVRGVVAFDGNTHLLYDFADIAAAVRQNRALPLHQLPSQTVAVEEGPIVEDLVIAKASQHLLTNSDVVTIITRTDGIGFRWLTCPKICVCPDDSDEVWEKADRPPDGQCPVHLVALSCDP